MGELNQLVYVSRASKTWSEDELAALLQNIRPKNHARGVTGMLLYDQQSFLQILEGAEDVLQELFAQIQRDTRHHQIVTILQKPIPKRQFPDWSMGFESVSADQLSKVDGLNDFFGEKACLADIDKGRALKILTAFENGRWRL